MLIPALGAGGGAARSAPVDPSEPSCVRYFLATAGRRPPVDESHGLFRFETDEAGGFH